MAMCTTESSAGSAPFPADYTLVYLSVHGGGCFAFPCDEAGTVEMNALSDRVRDDYLLAGSRARRPGLPLATECSNDDNDLARHSCAIESPVSLRSVVVLP